MTTFAFPTLSIPTFSTLDWWLDPNTQVFESPLDKSVQTLELPGSRWRFSGVFNVLQEPDAALLEGFLAQLRGRANRFTMYNQSRPVPRGTVNLSGVLVNGNQAAGTTLNIKTAGAAKTLLIGDYIGVNGEVKIVVANATADGSGNASVTFEPPLRAAVTDGMAVTTNQPTATFMLASPSDLRWSKMPPYLSTYTLEALESWT